MMKNFYSNYTIESIILRYSKRGMQLLRQHLPIDYCGQAAKSLLDNELGNVFLTTGFYVAGYAETDGPVGTYFLGKALKKIGYHPIIVTDKFCKDFFDEDFEVIYLPIEEENPKATYEKLIEAYQPTCLISIERCGKNQDNDYCNMRGISIKPHTAPIDYLFELAKENNILTIGIGDGGNEIGMGNLKNIITSKLELTPCVTTVDKLIIASVSNWGAYGLIAYLQNFTLLDLLPTYKEISDYLIKIVKIGSVDGVTKERSYTVDGFNNKIESEIINSITNVIHQPSFNEFTMSEYYAEASLSQYDIGLQVINKSLDYLQQERDHKIKILDIGCGPGNLTNTLYNTIDPNQVEITAIDIDANSINRAKAKYQGIFFEVKDLYEANEVESFDVIFSNEALHWMPKLPNIYQDEKSIIYYFFQDNRLKRYKEWGMNCYRKSFKNIYQTLKKGGISYLQFGLDGQLEKTYALINQVISDNYDDILTSFKLPLYYPSREEIEAVCEEVGFKILEVDNTKAPLSENTIEAIIGFLKAFMGNNLTSLLGEAKKEEAFQMIQKKLETLDLEAFRKDQWNHAIFKLQKV